MKYQLVASHSHPEDLEGGRVLAPGDRIELSTTEASHPHNKRLIDDELLVPVDSEQDPDILEGQALRDAGKEADIKGYQNMPANDLRKAIAEKEAGSNGGNS